MSITKEAEFTFFLAAAFITTMLALQLTEYWWRHRRNQAIGYWVLAIWIFVTADFAFMMSTGLSSMGIRFVSRVCVTAAYGALLLGAQRTAGVKPQARMVGGALIVYAASLALFSNSIETTFVRHLYGRAVWGAICVAGYFLLRRASRHFWGGLNTPATILLIQGIYNAARASSYGVLYVMDATAFDASLKYLDYVDVVLFDIALFVALMVALLNEGHEQVATSRTEIETLTGLLPTCAWCRKVRDDDGYWHEMADYFTKKNRVTLTHGICTSCADKLAKEAAATRKSGKPEN